MQRPRPAGGAGGLAPSPLQHPPPAAAHLGGLGGVGGEQAVGEGQVDEGEAPACHLAQREFGHLAQRDHLARCDHAAVGGGSVPRGARRKVNFYNQQRIQREQRPGAEERGRGGYDARGRADRRQRQHAGAHRATCKRSGWVQARIPKVCRMHAGAPAAPRSACMSMQGRRRRSGTSGSRALVARSPRNRCRTQPRTRDEGDGAPERACRSCRCRAGGSSCGALVVGSGGGGAALGDALPAGSHCHCLHRQGPRTPSAMAWRPLKRAAGGACGGQARAPLTAENGRPRRP